jgi:SET domain-containing protein
MDANLIKQRRSLTKLSNSQCSESVDHSHLLNALEVSRRFDDLIYLALGDLGWGVFAKRNIRRGEIILVFSGAVIGFAEAVAKGDRECWPLQIGHDRYIDLEEPGCYANHSCDPNSGILQDRFLVAISEIQKDTEIRYDYSTTVDEDYWSMECRCKSAKCRRIISDFKYLDPSLKAQYLSCGIVQRFIKAQYL